MSDSEAQALAGLISMPMSSVPKGKKPYMPPQPDANTFETQEEFLSSLEPTPIESVEQHNRKCPHCWKLYGESDPGLDNAEQPVKFRCGHVFGEKCMKEIVFRPPQSVTVDLRPIAFAPGSRGAKLGESLEKYFSRYQKEYKKAKNSDKAADGPYAAAPGDTPKLLVRLLNEAQHLEFGAELLSAEWSTLIQHVLSAPYHLLDVYFLENSIVCDIKEMEPSSFPTSFFPIHNYGTEFPVGFPMDSDGDSSEDDEVLQTLLKAHGTDVLPSTQDQLNELQSIYDESLLKLTPFQSTSPPDINASLFDGATLNKLGALKEKMKQADEPGINSSVFQKMKQADEPGINTSVFQKMKQSDEPGIKASVFQKMKQADEPGINTSVFQKMKQSDEPGIKASVFQKMKQAYKPESKAKANEEDKAEASEEDKEEANEEGEDLARNEGKQLPQETALVAKKTLLQKQHEFLAGNQQDAFQKSADRAKAEREARTKAMVTTIAHALEKVVQDYRKYQSETTSPPPPKKLKTSALALLEHPQNMIHARVTVHKHNLTSTHYDIPQPYVMMGSGSVDSSDVDSDVDSDAGTGQESSSGIVILVRSICKACCFHGGEARLRAEKKLGDPPKTIGWKNIKDTPDCCPLCKKVLFKKDSKPFGIGMASY